MNYIKKKKPYIPLKASLFSLVCQKMLPLCAIVFQIFALLRRFSRPNITLLLSGMRKDVFASLLIFLAPISVHLATAVLVHAQAPPTALDTIPSDMLLGNINALRPNMVSMWLLVARIPQAHHMHALLAYKQKTFPSPSLSVIFAVNLTRAWELGPRHALAPLKMWPQNARIIVS